MGLERPNLYSQRYNCIEETMKQSFISFKRGNSFKMIKREEGFSLVELLVTMVVFVLILTATSNTFIDLLKDFKKQSTLAETNIEGAVGLETLRRDIASAGTGLPWVIATGVTYNEADNDGVTTHNDTLFNESCFPDFTTCANAASDTQPPHAFVSGNGTGSFGSDILSIKSVSVHTDAEAQKWTYVNSSNQVKEWTPASENLGTSDRVIVLSLGTSDATRRTLIAVGTDFTTTYRADTNPDSLADTTGFKPTDASERYIVYGVTDDVSPVDTNLRMPFNRADYYIQRPDNYLSTCAPNTGALYKVKVSHVAGGVTPVMPILDCVADMQVAFRRDEDDDGDIDNTYDGDITTLLLTPAQIRQIKEVRVYILAHEGQRDTSYTSPDSIRVGDASISVGRNLDISAANRNYRWKLYVLVVKTENLK